jgi:CRP/FNR family transcriptional regulator, cyclic AMP receptor protein
MPDQSVTELIAQVPLFAGIDANALQALNDLTFTKTFQPGEAIVEEGHIGNGLYVILSGRVEVVKDDGTAREQALATFGPGDPFGELALLGEWKRTATVRAIEETTCVGMDRWLFLAYLERHPTVAVKMLQFVAHRLVETDARLGLGELR